MEINCQFEYENFFGSDIYTCVIKKASINEKYHVIKEFKGVHEAGKSHKDVQKVWFKSRSVKYFPLGLHQHFPSLIHLAIEGCNINEISKHDLAGLEGLFRLYVFDCELNSLPDDLLTSMPYLRTISFSGNNIKYASSELLKPLLGRQSVKVDLENNRNIGSFFWPGEDNSLQSLDELMKLIDEKCLKPNEPTYMNLWKTGKYSDLSIIAGDKKFKVHKAILGVHNSVFAQILDDQIDATEIRIRDFSSKSVEALLNFIYTNEIENYENKKENFEIAIKFKVSEMKSIYENIICNQVDDANSWELFLYAHRLSSQPLKEKAFQQIVKKIPDKVPEKLMEDPEKLKKLLDHRRAYYEMLAKEN